MTLLFNLTFKPRRLYEVFLCPEEKYEKLFNLLRTVKPPVIDQHNNFVLGERCKAAVVAWVDVMKRQYLRNDVPDKLLAKLLNAEIHHLNIKSDGRILRKAYEDAPRAIYKDYYKLFEDGI